MERQDSVPTPDRAALPGEGASGGIPAPQPSSASSPGLPPSLAALLPESVFTELCSLLRCSRGEVESAIRASQLHPDEAVAILQAAAPTFVAVKGRFEARKRGDLNGGFCLVADGISGELLDATYWVGSQALPEAFQIQASWESVRASLRQIPVLPEKTLWKQLDQLLNRLFPATALNLLFRDPESVQPKIGSLKEGLSRTFRVDFTCELQVERFHRLRLDMSPLAASSAPPPETASPSAPPKGPEIAEIRIPCRPHLDPVRGRPLVDLRPGDLIQVVVEETTGLGRLIARILARTGRVSAFPVETVEVLPSGDILVRLSISEGVHGTFKMSGDIRVRLNAPESSRPLASFLRPDSSWGLLFLLVAAGLLFLALLLYVLR